MGALQPGSAVFPRRVDPGCDQQLRVASVTSFNVRLIHHAWMDGCVLGVFSLEDDILDAVLVVAATGTFEARFDGAAVEG